jgi:hypothetical protein
VKPQTYANLASNQSNKRFASCDREQNNINKLTKQGNDDSTGCNNAAITDEFEDGGRIE